MVSVSRIIVDAAADVAAARVSPAGLADSARLEHELADDRRQALAAGAGLFDPEGLYALEIERDAAADRLVAAAGGLDVSLIRHETRVRLGGEWRADRRDWQVMIHHAAGTDQHVCEFAPTPSAAVDAALAALAAVAPPAPPAPPAVDMGVIRPETAADFLDLLKARAGRNDFVVIDLAGHVTVPARFGFVCDEEAAALRSYVAEHNSNDAVDARAALADAVAA